MYTSDYESGDGAVALRNKSKRDAKSSSPAPLGKTMSAGCILSDEATNPSRPLPAIEIIDEERSDSFLGTGGWSSFEALK